MAQTQNNHTPTDSIYQLSCYNSNGLIDKTRLKQYAALIFLGGFTASLTLIYIMMYLYYGAKLSEVMTLEFYEAFLAFNYEVIASMLMENKMPPTSYLINLSISTVIALIPTLYFILRTLKASKFQALLSSAGLSQYYFHKREGKSIYLKFKKSQKNAFKHFISQQENLAQMLGKENLQFKRWMSNGVIMQYSDRFPSIEELADLQVESFMKKDSLFLGIGLPLIGEVYEKSELIQGKYLARYLSITDIPQGVANLGSAGGGKSNTMNQYLYSLFYNFELIEAFYMVDFKGGIEAEPIRDLEERYKTGRIHVFDDNRLALYKTLKRLYFINKSRMRYLKTKKQKKFTKDFIVLIFDELAEILDFTHSTKEERKMQEKIGFYIESLLRTGRSQGFKVFYSTQSYLSTSSGLSSGMKNNTKLKVAHQLGSNLQVGSIKPVEELNEMGIAPTKYDVGKNVVINEADNTIYEVRSLYVPDDFIHSVKINTAHNSTLEAELTPHYQAIYEQMLEDLVQTGQEDDSIYSLHDIANDMGLSIKIAEPAQITEVKRDSTSEKKTPSISIAKAIHDKKAKQNASSKENEEEFLESLK